VTVDNHIDGKQHDERHRQPAGGIEERTSKRRSYGSSPCLERPSSTPRINRQAKPAVKITVVSPSVS